MPEPTLSSMHEARDAEDRRLLEEGNHTQLLANYFYLVEEWAYLRARNREAAEEIGQRVFVRLAAELRAGKTYTVPFRVVVWKVVHWTADGYEWKAKQDATLPESWDGAAPDELEEWEARHDLGLLIADLPDRDREVMHLTYAEGLSAAQIAERLGITPNAVHQAVWRGNRKVAEKLAG